MWIKICGMTSDQAVATAVGERVDALGFVFAPSVRQLEPVRAAQLAAPARGRVRCVAVTLHPTQELIEHILREFDPDVLQTDLEDLVDLRLPSALPVLPVLRAGATTPDTSPSGAWPARCRSACCSKGRAAAPGVRPIGARQQCSRPAHS